MQNCRFAGSNRTLERRRKICRFAHRLAMAAEGPRIGRDVGFFSFVADTRPGYSRS